VGAVRSHTVLERHEVHAGRGPLYRVQEVEDVEVLPPEDQGEIAADGITDEK
jgi:hypothetical protein